MNEFVPIVREQCYIGGVKPVSYNATDAATVGQMNAANAVQDTRMTAIEAVNSAQDTRLSAIDALNSTQNGRLTALEALSGPSAARLTALESGLTALNASNELYNRQASGGIAAAMAMGGTIIPADADGAVSFNLATYRGEQGFSGIAVIKAAPKIYFNAGVAGSTVRGSTGGRVGVTFGW